MPQWYQEWFDEYYLLTYAHRDDNDARQQVELICRTVRPTAETTVLDLACGDGRHAVLLAEHGCCVTGLDLSPTLIQRARERAPELTFYQRDMREIPGTYDLITSLFTSFGYFETDAENAAVIAAVSRALNPGGHYWLDFINPAYVRAHLEPVTRRQLDNGWQAEERRGIKDGRVVKRLTLTNGDQQKHYTESVRLFDRDALEHMLTQHGLAVTHAFGTIDGQPWHADAPRTILCAAAPD